MNKTITITVIVLVAVVMVMGAAAPAMAGNHGDKPVTDPPCESLDNPSDEREKAAEGKGKARTATDCD